MFFINFALILYGFTAIKYIINVEDKAKAKTKPDFYEKEGIFYLDTGFEDRQDTQGLLDTYTFLKGRLQNIFENKNAVLIHCDQGCNKWRKIYLFIKCFSYLFFKLSNLFFLNVFQICGNLSSLCDGV